MLTNTERSYAILDVHLRGGGHGLTCVWPVLLVLSVALEGDSLACTPVHRLYQLRAVLLRKRRHYMTLRLRKQYNRKHENIKILKWWLANHILIYLFPRVSCQVLKWMKRTAPP